METNTTLPTLTALDVTIALPKVYPNLELTEATWNQFRKSYSPGVMVNLGGIFVTHAGNKKSIRAILDTEFKSIREIDLAFVASLSDMGKLYLAVFGSFTTVVNVANGVFNSRRAVSIPIPTHRVKDFAAVATVPVRSQNEFLLVGRNPVYKRGGSIWDAGVIDTVIRILKEKYRVQTKRWKDFRFDALMLGELMYVELTYNGRFTASFHGRPTEINPAVILGISIGSFDEQLDVHLQDPDIIERKFGRKIIHDNGPQAEEEYLSKNKKLTKKELKVLNLKPPKPKKTKLNRLELDVLNLQGHSGKME